MEAVTRRHFFKHGDLEPNHPERRSCHWCQIRSFATHATLPITIVNDTGDGATIPPTFQFIDHSILREGVGPVEEEFRSGCECPDDNECMYGSCFCLQAMAPDSDVDSEDERGKDGQPRRKRFAYHSHGAKTGMLRSRILDSLEPIYECHSSCSCSKQCPNRVVERGRTIPLQIFRTNNKRGWGVRCPVDIEKGQFIDRYLGEIITSKEANRRRNQSNMTRHKDVYLFALDKFMSEDSPDHRLRGEPLEVDGEFMSGPTRFINHSCEPNMRIFARVGDHADMHIHDLALFAIKDIPRGTELTFDYQNGQEGLDDDAQDPKLKTHMTRCRCGSKKCRGFLW